MTPDVTARGGGYRFPGLSRGMDAERKPTGTYSRRVQKPFTRPPRAITTQPQKTENMMKKHTLLLTTLLTTATASFADHAILRDEARDAAAREQRELQERAEALAQQLEDARQLQALQDEYLQRLEAELGALRDDDAQRTGR